MFYSFRDYFCCFAYAVPLGDHFHHFTVIVMYASQMPNVSTGRFCMTLENNTRFVYCWSPKTALLMYSWTSGKIFWGSFYVGSQEQVVCREAYCHPFTCCWVTFAAWYIPNDIFWSWDLYWQLKISSLKPFFTYSIPETIQNKVSPCSCLLINF